MAQMQSTIRATEWLHSDPIDEEEFYDMVSREELRTLIDQATEMHQEWKEIQPELKRLNKIVTMTNARQVDMEGRVALLEKSVGVVENTTNHEVTERRTNVRIPIRRAAELLDSEKEAKDLSAMLARYRWWTGTFREASWGFAKLVGKIAGTASIGVIGKIFYDYWTKR